MPVSNKGRLINFVNGITGVTPGGNAVVNLPTNCRYHRNIFECSAVNYGGTGATGTGAFTGTLTAVATTSSGAGTGATVTLTVVNGAVTAAVLVAAGSGYAANDKLYPVDSTGTGAVINIATVSSGAVATIALTSGGTPSPINPVNFLTGVREMVNGVNMRDILPVNIMGIAQANGVMFNSALGELALNYTEPWRNVNNHNEVNSWDLFGQNTFQIQLQISPNVVSPGVIGISEFDFLRNVNVVGSNLVPFLQPVAQHQFSYNGIAGRNDINTLPFSFPIARIWIYGATPGQITQVEIYQDNNKVFEATVPQMKQAYQPYGFQFGTANYFNQTFAGSAVLKAGYNPVTYFDAAFISDPDQRIYKALQCANSFIVRVYSAVAQTITIVMETLPGSFAS